MTDALQGLIDLGNVAAGVVDGYVAEPLADTFGRPVDQIRIFVIFLAQYPNGWFMHYCLHGTFIRHIYNVTLGILLQLYLYGLKGIVHVVLMTLVAYLLMLLMPRQKQAPYVMFWVLGYLSYLHLDQLINRFGSYDMDITTYSMLQVCKLSALAYCYQDGGTDAAKLNQDQRDRMVSKLPSILEMCSYIWYAQACALGVFFEFSDYKRWIERTNEYANVPSPILPSLKWFSKGIVCLAVYTVVAPTFNIEICFADAYLEFSYMYRLFYYFVSMTVKRFFYYNPFCMTTGAIIASGLGYNGVKNETQEHSWDKVIGVYIWELETSTSPIEMLRFWNHQVHLWLKFYIMARLTKPGKRPGMFENVMTFMVSAFWHGFYPFYYVMFFFAGILSEVAKDCFKARALFSFIPSKLRPFVANFMSLFCLNYFGIWQNALTFKRGGAFTYGTFGIVPVGLIAVLVASRTLGLVKMAQRVEAKKTAAAGGAAKVVEMTNQATSADKPKAE